MSNPQEPSAPGQPPQWQQPPVPPSRAPGEPGPPEQYGAPGEYPAPGQNPAPAPYPSPGQQPAGQYPSPFGLPGQQPPAKSRKGLWIILGIVGGVLLLVIVGVVVLLKVVGGATNQAKGLAENFTKLLISGETGKAYDDFLDPKLQEQLSRDDFAAGVKSLEMDDTCKPAYDDLKVSSENGTNAADVAGVITCDGKKVELAYRFEGTDELKMINIKLKPKA
ncbi:hypothetical protein [Pseudarthrobacter sp. N5]|uniref:hypothetical protein n=1 Tax=Pseudarthrobacter sp. N5 TaxID=3418416 RepID=UPI003CF1883D